MTLEALRCRSKSGIYRSAMDDVGLVADWVTKASHDSQAQTKNLLRYKESVS